MRVLRYCTILFCSVLACAFAQCPSVVGDSNGNYLEPGVIASVEYRPGLFMDTYAPPGSLRPAALLIHGSSGNRSTHLTQLFPLLSNAGYAWFSVDYRNLADILDALQFIRCPGRYALTPSVTLIGEDTGVRLALEIAEKELVHQVIGFGSAMATASMPNPKVRMTLFHGDADDESPFAAIQKACGAWRDCRLERIPKGIHNLENWHPDQWEWREEFVTLLRDGRSGLWKDIVYSRPRGLPLLMDAYIVDSPKPSPAVIIAHGGGWEAGDKLTYISPILGPLARAGFTWFSIDYRLTPYVRNAEQLDDLRNAVRYVREHAMRYHIDPNRVAILGESASGQMVTQLASEGCQGCQPQAVVSFYGVYDFVPWAQSPEEKAMLDRIFGAWGLDTLRRYSPIDHVHSGLPPILLLQGTGDELCPGTLAYERQLTAFNVPHKMILLKGAPHGMENWQLHPEWAYYIDEVTAWLRQTLK